MSADFPFTGSSRISSGLTLPLFKIYAWDFTHNRFKRDIYGNLILLTGDDALKVWIEKALKTERFSYLAYSWNFGAEVKHLIGKVIGSNERRSELKRYISETLMVNPYIKSIDKLEISGNASLQVDIWLTTLYGHLKI